MKKSEENISNLLEQFNNKNSSAFGEMYVFLLKDIVYFTKKLYSTANLSIVAEDEVQDVFLKLWEDKNRQFANLSALKSYLYTSIKNRLVNNINKSKVAAKYEKRELLSEEYISAEIVEVETLALLNDAREILSDRLFTIFKDYMSGLDTKEIAEKYDKSEYTVYKQRSKIIEILKSTIKDKYTLTAFMSIINILH